jgi:hypothetical protein
MAGAKKSKVAKDKKKTPKAKVALKSKAKTAQNAWTKKPVKAAKPTLKAASKVAPTKSAKAKKKVASKTTPVGKKPRRAIIPRKKFQARAKMLGVLCLADGPVANGIKTVQFCIVKRFTEEVREAVAKKQIIAFPLNGNKIYTANGEAVIPAKTVEELLHNVATVQVAKAVAKGIASNVGKIQAKAVKKLGGSLAQSVQTTGFISSFDQNDPLTVAEKAEHDALIGKVVTNTVEFRGVQAGKAEEATDYGKGVTLFDEDIEQRGPLEFKDDGHRATIFDRDFFENESPEPMSAAELEALDKEREAALRAIDDNEQLSSAEACGGLAT